DADGGLVDDSRPWLDSELVRLVRRHHEYRCRSIRDLRAVAGGDLAVGAEHGLQFGERLHGRTGPDPLVGGDRLAVHLPRDQLPRKAPLLGRAARVLLGAGGDLVEIGAGEVPLVGDALRALALIDEVEALV